MSFHNLIMNQLDISCCPNNERLPSRYWTFMEHKVLFFIMKVSKWCQVPVLQKSFVDLDGAKDKCPKIWILLNKYLPKVPQISETLQNRWHFKKPTLPVSTPPLLLLQLTRNHKIFFSWQSCASEFGAAAFLAFNLMWMLWQSLEITHIKCL